MLTRFPASTSARSAAMLQVQLFLDEEDTFQGHSSSEHILRYLLHHKILGATLFKAHMGFGAHRHLNAPGKLGATDALPVMIMFIDEEEKVQHVLPHLKEVLASGLIVAHRTEPL